MHSDSADVTRLAGQPLVRAVRTIALVVGAIGLLTACTSYSAKEAPDIKAEAMPYRHNNGTVSLGVDPYSQSDRQQEIFAEDLAGVAVLPIHVVVTNGTEHPIRIEAENFRLTLPGKEGMAPASGATVAWLFTPQAGIADYAATGVSVLGGLGGPIGAIAGHVIALAASGVLGWSRGDALQDRQDDYGRKEIKPLTLGKNQSTRGFLFFLLPNGTPPFDEATLTLGIFENQTETARLGISLKGLGYKGLPSTKPGDSEQHPEVKTP